MAADPEVRTTAGTVRGGWENAVAVFRGIPYAQPPVGRHRFGYPVPTTRWDGVRDAVQFGPPAPQPHATTSDVDTDWLTLNVWSPDLGAAGLPVMVWIHGGRYLEGNTANPHQDGAILARTGVVMVSLNYRVGVEGFACIAGAPNNRGLLDQIAALHWVHDNIAAFGGNPANVTVFGQSAGGGGVASLLVMPAAKGLFHRAIAQSPPGTFFTENLATTVAGEIAAELGARATVAELQQLSPHTLVNASLGLLRRMPDFVNAWGPMALAPTPFSPIVDGVILPDAPWRALADGAARGINLVCGHTGDEYSLFNPLRRQSVSDELFAQTVDRLGPSTCAPSQYRAAYPEATTSQLYETVNADWLFRMPCQHLAAAHRAGAAPHGFTNWRGVSTPMRAPPTAWMCSWSSAHSTATTSPTTPPHTRAPPTNTSMSPTRCAQTGPHSPLVANRVGQPMSRTLDPRGFTTPRRPTGPTPKKLPADSGRAIDSQRLTASTESNADPSNSIACENRSKFSGAQAHFR